MYTKEGGKKNTKSVERVMVINDRKADAKCMGSSARTYNYYYYYSTAIVEPYIYNFVLDFFI